MLAYVYKKYLFQKHDEKAEEDLMKRVKQQKN